MTLGHSDKRILGCPVEAPGSPVVPLPPLYGPGFLLEPARDKGILVGSGLLGHLECGEVGRICYHSWKICAKLQSEIATCGSWSLIVQRQIWPAPQKHVLLEAVPEPPWTTWCPGNPTVVLGGRTRIKVRCLALGTLQTNLERYPAPKG